MNDIVNLIVNNGVAVGVVAYFLYKDHKWNEELVKSLTAIEVTLQSLVKDNKNNEH